MRKLIIFLSLGLLLFCLSATAQVQPFADEIAAFRHADSLQAPPKNAIVFVGSSSFRLWKDVQQAFPQHTIINRGFGGSSLPDIFLYAKHIIFSYQPKQVVVYCGENDLAASDTVNGEDVYIRFVGLHSLIRVMAPDTHVAYVSMKPSPSRWHLKDKMLDGNSRIKKFLKRQKKATYIDVWEPMLNEAGLPNEELFLNDKLHMNEKGYAIWQKQIEPHLKK